MDPSERQGILADLALCHGALSAGVSPDRMGELLTLKAGYQTRLRDLIPEAPSPVSDQQWQQVSGELKRDTNAVSSHIATGTKTLPVVNRTQANRVRLEEENCLLIRQPLFSQYEQAILGGARQFFGLTGPQGFGKSAFLQYLAVKHCHGGAYVVLYLPFCPAHEESLKRDLAVAFYRGCRIAGLVGYPELTCGDNLVRMVQRCVGFALSQQKTLLLVVDQMKTEPRDVFQHTVRNLRNIGTLDNVKVVLSSSTSHIYGPVFGTLFWHLKRYSDKLTAEEAAALSTEYSSMGVNVRAEDLSGLPFQAAALKLRSTPGMPSLTELATDLADHLLSLPNTNEKMDTYGFLLMVADSTRKDSEAKVSFGSSLDRDHFYIEKDELGYYIAEHFDGYAHEVLAIMQQRHGDYEQYLVGVLGNTNFTTLDPGAQGRIVEDAFFLILRGEANTVFPLIRIPEGVKTNPPNLRVQANNKSVIEVPGGDKEVLTEVHWPDGVETLVFIPRHRQYVGVDFIVARRTENTLFIYYAQVTVEQPIKHSIHEADHYCKWHEVLQSSAQRKNCQVYLVFLTKHSTDLKPPPPGSLATFFDGKTLHVQFCKVQGSHRLLDGIKARFPN